MHIDRRGFITQGIGAAGLLSTGVSLPGFLARTARAATIGTGQPILVVVQLSGGNDGLNTIIPYENDAYHRARPTLRIDKNRVLRLNDQLGLHPDMPGFKKLFDAGELAVLTNVGYPNPDRSHFRSMDIWHTATMKPEESRDGWLGRMVDQADGSARKSAGSEVPCALHLDDGALPLALKTQRRAVPSVRSIDAFKLPAGVDGIEAVIAADRPGASDDLLFVQRVAVSSCANAGRIDGMNRENGNGYPGSGLATRLRQIAQLIGASFGARIYYTSISGFDTHARQVLAHGPLLRELSESVAAFFADLSNRGLANQVLLMTFSEFGRRVAENGSGGTDHGAAAPLFLAGPACKSGIIGAPPDLSALDEGDVRHHLDFRQVYATVLSRWLRVNPASILAGDFKPLELLRR